MVNICYVKYWVINCFFENKTGQRAIIKWQKKVTSFTYFPIHVQYVLHILEIKEMNEREGGKGSKRDEGKNMSILFWKQQSKYDSEMHSW